MLPHAAVGEGVHLGYEAVEEVAVVAHYDGRAVKGAYGLLEHVLRGHVEVVGGLVENEQVDRLEQQAEHGQAAALASAEHAHALLRGFASEHERAQYVVDFEAHLAVRGAVDGVVDGKALVEQLRLVLREVAYLDVVAYLERAGEGDFAHDALHQRRLALAVAANEGHLLAAAYREVYVREHRVLPVGLAHAVAHYGPVAAALARGKLQAHGRAVNLVHLDGYDFLQLLYAALHLHGLRGLVAEALYEVLDVGYLLLLVLPGAQLLLAPLGAQAHVLVVPYAVVLHAAAGYFERARGDVVEEGAVVADQHYGLGRRCQELLQPPDALYVEVVGRLVEQQHVGAREQDFGQLHAHTPAPAELGGGAVEVGAAEAQACKRALYVGLVALRAHEHVALVLAREAVNEGHVLRRVVVAPRGQLGLHGVEARLQGGVAGEGLARLLAHGGVVGQAHHLGQVAYRGALRHGYRAPRGLLLPA